MSVKDVITNYDPSVIKKAHDQLEITRKLRKQLSGSKWALLPINFGTDTFILPGVTDYRPLAVTPHRYGLWIEPLVTEGNETTFPFALHIDESEEGIAIYVDDAFRLTISGDHEAGFTLETTSMENTTLIESKEE